MSKLSRRSILQGVAGAAVVVPAASRAAPHPAAFPLTHDADLELIELRRAIDAYQAAVQFEMSIEGTPGHAAAVAESDAREAIIEAFVESIHERTPTSMRDIALRAEALRQFFFDGPAHCFKDWGETDCITFHMAKLYEAAVLVAGGGNV